MNRILKLSELKKSRYYIKEKDLTVKNSPFEESEPITLYRKISDEKSVEIIFKVRFFTETYFNEKTAEEQDEFNHDKNELVIAIGEIDNEYIE